jgi:uncharacterized membrane protein YccF (DUF307 family)
MGDFANGRVVNALGWLIVTIMTVASIAPFAIGGTSFYIPQHVARMPELGRRGDARRRPMGRE